MKVYSTVIRWSWEFPQSFLGAILTLFYKKYKLRVIEYKDQKVYIYDKFPGGISLGYYTLVDYNRIPANPEMANNRLATSIKHEYGHSIQSHYLGPLYLFLIGIPSGIHNIICRIKRYNGIPYNYYDFFIEKSADKLGKVNRYE